jgi:ubiquinone/menaquinone biosynthesis C-methylase UbiE
MVAKKITQCMKPHGEEGFETIENMNVNHKEISEFAFSILDVGSDDNILDIGCGGGVNIEKFLKLTSGNVNGLDYSEVSVEASIKQNHIAVENGRCNVKCFPLGLGWRNVSVCD